MSVADTEGSDSAGLEWLERHPHVQFVTLAAHDLNGVLRGKRLPRSLVAKALAGEIKMPLALLGVDIWGRDVVGSGQVFETGDQDGYCIPTERGILSVAEEEAEALLLVSLSTGNGQPYAADPRNALASVVAGFAAKGMTPVCATELEFYLFDPERSSAEMAAAARSGGRGRTSAIYAVSELETFEPFLHDVYQACHQFEIPAESALAESGTGQFEINFRHVADAVRAADDALCFKYLVKRVARKHGLGATFMAKPFGEDSGSGLHIHFSLVDQEGVNLFDEGKRTGSPLLRQAIAGMLQFMPESTLLFAPHFNSYRRLRSETHAPISIAWGYENRTAAVRVPEGPGSARRIEHRVAGADANPYLVMAAVLGAALRGIEQQMEAPPPITGSAYDLDLAQLPTSWTGAMQHFQTGRFASDLFGPLLPRMYAACKKQEFESFADIVSPLEYDLYLDRV